MTAATDGTEEALPGVGFIGLGHMGSAMANQLVSAGFDVTVWSRSRRHVDDLVERGATAAPSPAEAIATGHVFSMLANEEVVRSVMSAEQFAAAPAGCIHVNHATISSRAAHEFGQVAVAAGHRYVAAPVLGRPNVASAGQLTILAAGDPGAVDASMPMLQAMGRRVWRWGAKPGNANLVKISVNYLIIHALQALAESITMLERRELDTGQFVELINDSLFPGAVYGGYGSAIARSMYTPPGFSTVLGFKDLLLALEAAQDAGVHLPSGPMLEEIFQATIAEVGEDLDWAAIAEITRRRSVDAANSRGGVL